MSHSGICKRVKILTLSGLFFFALLAPVLSHADTITLVADEWCPINCEPGSEMPGYAIEVAQFVFGKAGHEIVYQNLNWSKSIEDARKGLYGGIVGAAKDEAEDFVFPRNTIGASANSFFVAAGSSWSYKDLGSLENVCVAAIKSYEYGEELAVYFEKNKNDPKKVQFVSGDNPLEKNFKKLEGGRVDVVVEDRPVGDFTIKEMGLTGKIKVAGNDGDFTDFYIAFSPANPKSGEYAEILSKGLDDLRASGKLNEILSRYGMTDWK